MNAADGINHITFAPILEQAGLDYILADSWLQSKRMVRHQDWIIYIATKTSVLARAVAVVTPVLRARDLAFKIIANEEQSYYLNAGGLGAGNIGKGISIFIASAEKAQDIITLLSHHFQEFTGPVVPDAVRVDKNIYVQQVVMELDPVTGANELHAVTPPINKCPFTIPAAYHPKKKKKFIRQYLRLNILKSNPKGETILAFSFRKFPFKQVVLKEGLHNAVDDSAGRDIRDRLLWQKTLLERVGDLVLTARFIDLFDLNNCTYLVIEYIDGPTLPVKADQLKHGKIWQHLDTAIRCQLLDYFGQCVEIVHQLHLQGLVHRDIRDSNFVITEGNRVYILDFELAFDLKIRQPDPPFAMGTFGYMAPEQAVGEPPQPGADLYSLGALLAFILIGIQPWDFPKEWDELESKLDAHTKSLELITIVRSCMSFNPAKRMDTLHISAAVRSYINFLKKEIDAYN